MGIDSGIDGQKLLYPEAYDQIIDLPTSEAAHLVPDNSFHLTLVDALHTYTGVITDYFLYKEKVKHGAYIAFHDTAPQAQGTDWQRTGDKDDPNQYIQVRKALSDIGLFKDAGYDWEAIVAGVRYTGGGGFRLVFDEHDTEDAAGGICVFKNIA